MTTHEEKKLAHAQANTKNLMSEIDKLIKRAAYQPPETKYLELGIWNIAIAEVHRCQEADRDCFVAWLRHMGANELAAKVADGEHVAWLDEQRFGPR